MVDLSNPVVPIVTLGVISYGNDWYNTGNPLNIKPLLFAGVSAILLEAIAAGIGDKAATMLGWTAVVAMLISPIQNPSPIDNLLKIGTAVVPNKKPPAAKKKK